MFNIGLKIKELMSKQKIDSPELAKRLGKTKQAVYDMIEKQDLNTSLLRELSVIFNVPVTFFFTDKEEIDSASEKVELLKAENYDLKREVERLKNLKLPTKDSKIYNLWMKFMEITSEMQELYQKEKEGQGHG